MWLLVQTCKPTSCHAQGDRLQERDIQGTTWVHWSFLRPGPSENRAWNIDQRVRSFETCKPRGQVWGRKGNWGRKKKGIGGNAGLHWPGLHSEPPRAITGCGWLNNGPQRHPHPNSQTCECAIWQSKSNFISVTKLVILGRGACRGLSTWAQWNHKSPYKREARVSQQKQRWE